MVGFIGALSSSLCIVILIFVTLLMGYIKSLLPDGSLFQIDEATFRYPLKSYFIDETMESELKEVLIKVKQDDVQVNSIKVGCYYGLDLDESMANNISIYNTIKINQFNLESNYEVTMYKKMPKEEHKMNYCFVDLNKSNSGE
ncbi:hypothetical protein [Vibrio sp. ER1A]|uniref:hypothetical protein n=1 Tax=Vibrio sp. ER1A TaxID=1517681 RepID=UPI0004DD0658|nr:hypothetical protein [Vibrio sp. ER1A]KFA99250.1 hypothetical protein HW45_04940 [Vibrio sp. ER1A]